MAKVIAFCSTKGGGGKTTGAYNFAIFLARTTARVMLLDTDPNGASIRLMGLRGDRSPQMAGLHITRDVRAKIVELLPDYDWIVIDTPGFLGAETHRIMALVNIMVVPCKLSGQDLAELPKSDDLAQDVRALRPDLPALLYWSDTPPGRSGSNWRAEAAGAVADLQALKVLEHHTSRKIVYIASSHTGLGIVEGDDPVAAAEFTAVAKEICSYV